MEYKQLCRLIIAKILSIDFYMEEIAELKGSKYSDRFKSSFEIKEGEYQELNNLQEELHREYDLLVFQNVLEEKLSGFQTHHSKGVPVLSVENLQKEAEVEKVFIEKKVKARMEEEERLEREEEKERKREKIIKTFKPEKRMKVTSEDRNEEKPFGIKPEEETVFTSEVEFEPNNTVDTEVVVLEPVEEADANSSVELPSVELPKESQPEPEATPKEAAPNPKPKRERARPIMRKQRVYISDEDFDEEY